MFVRIGTDLIILTTFNFHCCYMGQSATDQIMAIMNKQASLFKIIRATWVYPKFCFVFKLNSSFGKLLVSNLTINLNNFATHIRSLTV